MQTYFITSNKTNNIKKAYSNTNNTNFKINTASQNPFGAAIKPTSLAKDVFESSTKRKVAAGILATVATGANAIVKHFDKTRIFDKIPPLEAIPKANYPELTEQIPQETYDMLKKFEFTPTKSVDEYIDSYGFNDEQKELFRNNLNLNSQNEEDKIYKAAGFEIYNKKFSVDNDNPDVIQYAKGKKFANYVSGFMKNITKENFALFAMLQTPKYEDYEYYSETIIRHIKPQSINIVADMIRRQVNGDSFFEDPRDISYILNGKSVENLSESAYATLVNTKDGNKNSQIFSSIFNFSALIENVNKYNERVLPELVHRKIFNSVIANPSKLLKAVKPENIAALPILLNAKYKDEALFDSFEVATILEAVNADNIKILPNLIKDSLVNLNIAGSSRAYIIAKVLSCTNQDNINSINILLNVNYSRKSINFVNFVDLINKDNSEILKQALLDYSLTEYEMPDILRKIKNEDLGTFKKVLHMRESCFPYVKRFSVAAGIADTTLAFREPNLKPIAKKIINNKSFITDVYRFYSLNGIYDLCKLLSEKHEYISVFNKVRKMKDKKRYRAEKIKDVLELTNALGDSSTRKITQEILDLKIDGENIYLFNNFSNLYKSLKAAKNPIEIERIKLFSNVKSSYSFDKIAYGLPEIIDLVDTSAKMSIDSIPVPKTSRVDVNSYMSNLEKLAKLNESNTFNNVASIFTLEEKMNLASFLSEVEQINPLFKAQMADKIVKNLMKNTITGYDILNEDRVNFFKSFMSNKPEVEAKLKKANFAQFKKAGLPLTYSRKSFIKDLNDILAPLGEKDREHLLNKLSIQLTGDKNGYNGILDLSVLDLSNKIEAKVYNIANNFIYNNRVDLKDATLSNLANSLIKGMPELINVIGKQQHGTQDFSVDIHTLQVLKNTMTQPEYDTLPSLDKTVLKLAILLHDIGKKEGIVDKSHQNTSAMYSEGILQKYNLPVAVNDHIYRLIKNHHWLEAYNTKAVTPQRLAMSFTNPNDYKMGKMMSYADLKSVNIQLFNMYKDVLSDGVQKPLVDKITEFNENRIPLFTSKVVFPNMIPEVEREGYKYRVLDFTKFEDDDDVSSLGFIPGTKMSDLRFLIHASSSENLKKIDYLSDVKNTSVISQSYISPNKAATYYSEASGVVLDSSNVNIVNAYRENQGSGLKKDENQLEMLYFSPMYSIYRHFIPRKISEALGISKSSYSKLYDKIANNKYIAQIADEQEFVLPEKTVSGKDVKAAIKNVTDELLQETRSTHNEVVTQNPRVVGLFAKANSIDEISEDYLRFVRNNNLPIYIFSRN